MAFAAPDPKRVEADRRRVEDRRNQDIAILEQQRNKRVQTQACYEEHTPKQVVDAHDKIRFHNDGARRVLTAEEIAANCWERVGRSRGGKRKGNLYRCLVQ